MYKNLILFIFLAFPFHIWQIFGVGSFGVTASDFLILILNALFILRIIFIKGQLRFINYGSSKLIFIFLSLALISSFSVLIRGDGEQIVQFFKTFIHLIYLVFFGLIAFTEKFDKKLLNNIIKGLLILSIPVNLYGIYQLFARAFDLPFAWIQLSNVSLTDRGNVDINEMEQLAIKFKNFYRATSLFSEPSALAAWNMLIFSFIFPGFFKNNSHFFKSKSIIYLIASLCIGASFLTFSLTAAVGFGLMILYGLIYDKKDSTAIFYRVAILFAVLVILIEIIVSSLLEVSIFELFYQRFESIYFSLIESDRSKLMAGDSVSYRADKMNISFNIFLLSPLIGVGLGQFGNFERNHVFADVSLFQILAELGFISSIIFLLIFISGFYSYRKIIAKDRKFNILNESDNKLLNTIPYLIIHQFFINTLTGNQFIGLGMWLPMFLVFAILSRYIDIIGIKWSTIKIYENPSFSNLTIRLKGFLHQTSTGFSKN